MLLLLGPLEGRLDGPDQVSPVVQADGPVGFGRAVLVGAFDPPAAAAQTAGFDPLGNMLGPEVSHQHVGFEIIQEGDEGVERIEVEGSRGGVSAVELRKDAGHVRDETFFPDRLTVGHQCVILVPSGLLRTDLRTDTRRKRANSKVVSGCKQMV